MTKTTNNIASKPAGKKPASKKLPTQNPSSMKTTEIRNLIDFIAHSGLNEVDIETKELKIHVKREPDQKVLKSSAPTVSAMAAPQPVVAVPPPPAPSPLAIPQPPASASKMVEIKSPMIGTFYRSSNPDSPAFVSVGDKVTKGQTVCIIEAMKLFNEIESDISGTITKVMVENATPVEYEQPLFLVEPD